MLRNLRFLILIALAPAAFLLIFWLVVGAPLHTSYIPAAEKIPAQPSRPLTAEQGDMVLDLFNPSQGLVDQQQSNAQLSEQLEQALTVSFILRSCDYLSHDDYADTYRAIVTYATRMHLGATPEDMQVQLRNITESANASYSLIYSRTDCHDPKLQPLTDRLEQWRDSILKH